MTRELFLELYTGLLREMLRIRRFEEKCAELYSATKIRGFLHLYIGEEAIAVGMMAALTPEDAIVATVRNPSLWVGSVLGCGCGLWGSLNGSIADSCRCLLYRYEGGAC